MMNEQPVIIFESGTGHVKVRLRGETAEDFSVVRQAGAARASALQSYEPGRRRPAAKLISGELKKHYGVNS